MDRKYTGSRDMEVCEANLLMVAIYFRLPAIWDENFILNDERIRHNEVISKKTIKFFWKISQILHRIYFEWDNIGCWISSNFRKFLSRPLNHPRSSKLVYLSDWPIFDAHDVNTSNEMVQSNKKYWNIAESAPFKDAFVSKLINTFVTSCDTFMWHPLQNRF